MIKVGITGNIGSGKSLVSRIFMSLGVPVFFADKEASSLFEIPEVINRIAEEVDIKVLVGGIIDKRILANIVFKNREKLLALNRVIHPLTFELFDTWILHQSTSYVIMESAVIAEYKLESKFDKIIAVSAPESLRINRVMLRDGVEESLVLDRMNNQLQSNEILKSAHYNIINDEQQMLIPQIISVHQKIMNIS